MTNRFIKGLLFTVAAAALAFAGTNAADIGADAQLASVIAAVTTVVAAYLRDEADDE